MNILDRIQWHEGMLLTPQHFQLESTRVDNLIAWHTIASAGHSWGVRKLEVDVSLLASGIFRVLELDAIMPDGTAVRINSKESSDSPLELKIDPHSDSSQYEEKGSVDIFLSIAISRKTNNPDGVSRFKSVVSPPVEDDVSEAVAVDIPRLKNTLKLFSYNTPPGSYISFRLCSVIIENDVIRLGKTLPPLLDIYAAPDLINRVRKLVENIRSKATFLAKQIKGSANQTNKKDEILLIQRLNSLTTVLPQIEAISMLPKASPVSLYLTLCTALGPLSQIKFGGLPPTPAPYEHENIFYVFNYLLEALTSLVNEISQDYREIPFQKIDDNFELSFKPEWITKTLVIGIKGVDSKSSDLWFNSLIIGSKNYIEEYREKRILGVKRRRVIGGVEKMNLREIPGIDLFEIMTPENFSESDKCLVLSPSTNNDFRKKPYSLFLYVNEKN